MIHFIDHFPCRWSGGFMGWDIPCRLRHVTSGRYLAITDDNQVVTVHRAIATEDSSAFLLRKTKVQAIKMLLSQSWNAPNLCHHQAYLNCSFHWLHVILSNTITLTHSRMTASWQTAVKMKEWELLTSNMVILWSISNTWRLDCGCPIKHLRPRRGVLAEWRRRRYVQLWSPLIIPPRPHEYSKWFWSTGLISLGRGDGGGSHGWWSHCV